MVARQHRVTRVFELDRPLQVPQGSRSLHLRRILPGKIDIGATAIKRRPPGPYGDGAADLFECRVGLSILQVDVAERGKCFRPAAVDLDRSIEVARRRREVSLLQPQQPLIDKQGVAKLARSRIEQLERPAIVGGGGVSLKRRFVPIKLLLRWVLFNPCAGLHGQLVRRKTAQQVKPGQARLGAGGTRSDRSSPRRIA